MDSHYYTLYSSRVWVSYFDLNWVDEDDVIMSPKRKEDERNETRLER